MITLWGKRELLVAEQKLKTLINHPFEVMKKYGYAAQEKLAGYRIPRLNHNYERFFQVERDDVVIDVGAHIGLFTISIAAKAGKVLAIEPEPRNLHYLRYNISTRSLDNVLIVEKAVWNRKKKLPLYLSNASGNHSLIHDMQPLNTSITNCFITVETDTLDNIVSELNLMHVDFIKMDIEGAEIEALEGAKETLKKTSKIAIASYHKRNGTKTSTDITRKLVKSRFQTYATTDDIVYGYKK